MKTEEKAPPEEKKTYRQILDSAVEVFASKGYHNTRVDDIVQSSGTSKGAFYFYFPSKEKIFLSVVDDFANRLAEALEESIEQEEQGIQRVDAALQRCLRIFGKYRHLAKIFLIQAAGIGPAFEEKRMDIHNRFAQTIKVYLDQAIDEGDIAPIDTQVASLAWMGAINEVVIRWVLSGEPEPERSLPALRTILLRSVGVSEADIQKLEAIQP